MDKRGALRYRIAPLEMTPGEFRSDGVVDATGQGNIRNVVARGVEPCLGDRYGGGGALAGARPDDALSTGLVHALTHVGGIAGIRALGGFPVPPGY